MWIKSFFGRVEYLTNAFHLNYLHSERLWWAVPTLPAVVPAQAGIQELSICWTRLRSSLRCELRRGKPGFRPDYYPHLTPGVLMEFVFFTTKDTKRTKKPELRVLRALRGVIRTCRTFETAM